MKETASFNPFTFLLQVCQQNDDSWLCKIEKLFLLYSSSLIQRINMTLTKK